MTESPSTGSGGSLPSFVMTAFLYIERSCARIILEYNLHVYRSIYSNTFRLHSPPARLLSFAFHARSSSFLCHFPGAYHIFFEQAWAEGNGEPCNVLPPRRHPTGSGLYIISP